MEINDIFSWIFFNQDCYTCILYVLYPIDARPVDESTLHGQLILQKRLQNKQTREARNIVFENFSTPAEQLEQWPKCLAMTSRELERQKYVGQLTSIMTDAKKLNGVMADARIRQIGKNFDLEYRFKM